MSRGEFGSSSYGTLSPDARVNFDRPSSRYLEGENFQILSDNVSSNIFQINNNTAALERTLKQFIAGKDGQEEKLHRIQRATNDLASKTTALLKQMSSYCVGNSPTARQQRVQHERLKGDFRDSVSRYYSVQNKVVEKEKLLVGSTGLSQRQDSRRYGDEFGNEKSGLIEDDRQRQEQEQLDMQIDTDQSLIREREDRIQQIEGDIIDINEIFRDLATMVYEQGELVDSIEANVCDAQRNVEGANVQLSKANAYQKSARKKMCILLLILVVVGGVIGIIIWQTTK